MKQRRNLMRFGLKSILVLTTLVAVICGVWLRQAQVQREVCEHLSTAGIKMKLDTPAEWLSWLPQSVLSLGGGHFFCSVTDVQLRYEGKTPDGHVPHDNDLLVWVSRLPNLKHLRIEGSLVDPRDFSLLSNCRKLESLDLAYGSLVDDGVASLPRMRSLRLLSLGANPQLTGRYIDAHRFPSLESLDLYSTQLGDDALQEIARISNLKSLSLAYTNVTDLGVVSISSLKKLETLDLSNTRVTGRGIGAFEKLESIALCDTDLKDEAFSEIRKLLELQKLDVSYCMLITDDGLGALAHHPSLREFLAYRCNITDASTHSLATIGTLEDLRLADSQVRSVREFAACKSLKLITISSSEVPVEDAMLFSDHEDCSIVIGDPSAEVKEPAFRWWCGCFGGGPTYLTNSELASMSGTLVGGNGQILVLDGLVGLSAKHLENFGCNVELLSLVRSRYQSDFLPYLKNWPMLVALHANQCVLSDSDVDALGRLVQLTSLELGGSNLDDGDMHKLGALSELTRIGLGKTRLTPRSVQILKGFKQLSSVTLPFKPEVDLLIELMEACPSLELIECLSSELAFTAEVVTPDGIFLRDFEVSSAQLDRLLRLQKERGSESYMLAGEMLSDEHCEVIANYENIASLDLSHSKVTDVGMAHLTKALGLRTLNLTDTQVTPVGLKSLGAKVRLQSLICSPRIWSAEWSDAVFEIPSLTELGLPFSQLTREAAWYFLAKPTPKGLTWFEGLDDRNCINLMSNEMDWMCGRSPFSIEGRQLTLLGALVDDEKLAEVVSSPSLISAIVKNVPCSPTRLVEKLLGCSNLRELQLSGVGLTPTELSRLQDLDHLQTLNLEDCVVTLEHLRAIVACQRLSAITFPVGDLQIHELLELAKLPRLRRLALIADEPAAKYEELQHQLGKRCEIVRVGR